MDMAEKDETEGWRPACLAPYNKEKVVDMAGKVTYELVFHSSG